MNFYRHHQTNRPLVFAHRGYSARHPENSLAAFGAARDAGADGIECDLRLSADGVVVVIHDPLVDATTNGTGAVDEMTWSELGRLRLRGVDGGLSDQRIPRLEELRAIVPDDMLLNLELKPTAKSGAALVRAVAGIVDGWDRDRLLISSFDVPLLREMQRTLPAVSTAVLVGGRIPDALGLVRWAEAEALHLDAESVRIEDIAEFEAAGLPWAVYAIWRQQDLTHLAKAAAVFLDDPGWARKPRP